MKGLLGSGELIEIARLYYDKQKTQQEIAERLGISRSTVSRQLDKARRLGIVRIQIINDTEELNDLAWELETRFGLRRAFVAPSSEDEPEHTVKRNIGIAAASCIPRFIRQNDIVGVAWGSTLYEVFENLKNLSPDSALKISVVQLIGAVGEMVDNTHANEVARSAAAAFGGDWYLLPAPGVCAGKSARDMFFHEPSVKRVIEMGKRANVAIISVGACHPSSIMVSSGYATAREISILRERGAIGDTCCRFYDAQGRPVKSDIDSRTLGIRLEDLRKVPLKIVIAGGLMKAHALVGAIRGGYCDILITDQIAAMEMLRILREIKLTSAGNLLAKCP